MKNSGYEFSGGALIKRAKDYLLKNGRHRAFAASNYVRFKQPVSGRFPQKNCASAHKSVSRAFGKWRCGQPLAGGAFARKVYCTVRVLIVAARCSKVFFNGRNLFRRMFTNRFSKRREEAGFAKFGPAQASSRLIINHLRQLQHPLPEQMMVAR